MPVALRRASAAAARRKAPCSDGLGACAASVDGARIRLMVMMNARNGASRISPVFGLRGSSIARASGQCCVVTGRSSPCAMRCRAVPSASSTAKPSGTHSVEGTSATTMVVPPLVTFSCSPAATTVSPGFSGDVIRSVPSRQRTGKSHTSVTPHVSSRAIESRWPSPSRAAAAAGSPRRGANQRRRGRTSSSFPSGAAGEHASAGKQGRHVRSEARWWPHVGDARAARRNCVHR